MDIQLQDARVPSAGEPGVCQCFVGPKARAARERVGDEPAFEDRLHHIGESVVHHPIPEWRGGNQARFRIHDPERMIGAGAVTAVDEFTLKPVQFRLQIGPEGGHIGP